MWNFGLKDLSGLTFFKNQIGQLLRFGIFIDINNLTFEGEALGGSTWGQPR